MAGIARALRLAFDGLRGIRPVFKLQRIAIDDSVVGEPERGPGRGKEDEFRECGARNAKTGELRDGHTARKEVESHDDCGHRDGQKPSVIARQACRHQTQAAFCEGLGIATHRLAEIDHDPQEEREVQGLAHRGRLQIDQIRIRGEDQGGGPRGYVRGDSCGDWGSGTGYSGARE